MHILTLLNKSKETVLDAINKIDDISIIPSESIEECLGLVNILPDIDAIILDDDFLDDILIAIKSESLNIDFIYYGQKSVEVELIYFKQVQNTGSLVDYLDSGLKVTPILKDDDTQYTKITSSSLSSLKKSPADIYLRIKNGDFYNYIKYFAKDSLIDHSKVKEQREKGLKDYFVRTDELLIFTDYLNRLYNKVLTQKNLANDSLSKDSIAQIFKQLNSIGFSKESCDLAYKTVENLTKSKNKSLMKELRDIFKNKNSYKFKKSIMTSMILIHFTNKLDWVTADSKNALSMCSFLCDRELKDDDMASISTEGELSVSKYLEHEKKIIMNHAQVASDWASGFDEFSSDLCRLIKQHHGSISGHGFVKVLPTQLSLVSILYILIESVSQRILSTNGGKININSIITDIKNEFTSSKLDTLADEFLAFLKKSMTQ